MKNTQNILKVITIIVLILSKKKAELTKKLTVAQNMITQK